MGALNISSMDLRAVNAQRTVSPKAARKKTPRYKVPAVSRSRKFFMLAGTMLLLSMALLLPPASELPAAVGISGSSQAFVVADGMHTDPPPVSPQRLSSAQFARNRVELLAAPVSARAAELEPIRQALPFAPATAGDTAIAISVLSRYIQDGSEEQKREARLLIDTFRTENLHEALLELIRNQEEAGLAVTTRLALDLKVPGSLEAIIARLQSTQKKPYARPELLSALASFTGNEKADALIDALLKGPDTADRSNLWAALAAPLPAKYVNLAFERVLKGQGDAGAASEALGRHGQTSEAAFDILSRAEKHMQNTDQELRLRMVKLMCELDIHTVAPRLGMAAYDSNPAIRATVLTALAKSPSNLELLIQMLQSDENIAVKQACLEGLGNSAVPGKFVLRAVAGYLNHPALRHAAKRALVRAHNGTDLGWQEFEWNNWIETLQ